MINKKKMSVIIMALILCFSFSGCLLYPNEAKVVTPPSVKPLKVTYDLMEVTKGDLKLELNCAGDIVYIVQQDLSFQGRGGRLKALHVQLGDEVVKGQLLAELDTSVLNEDIEQQKIILQKSKTAYTSVVSSGNNDIKLAELNLAGLEDQYAEMTSFSSNPDGGVATNDVYTQKDLKNIKRQIEEQQLSIDKLKAQYGKGGYAIEQASQDIQIQELKLKELQEELAKSMLVSPYSGIVVNVDPTVNIGGEVVMNKSFITIADKSKLQIRYSGDDVTTFVLGMKVKVKINGVDYDGKVVVTPANAPFTDVTEGGDSSYVQIDVKNLPADISAGDQVDINAVLQEKKDVIIVPKNVVHSLDEQSLVFVLENGLKKERIIQTGMETDTEYEVVKGLSVGEKIIR